MTRSEMSITTPISCSISAIVVQQQLRLHGERTAELDPLLQSVRQPSDRGLTDRLNFEKIDDLLDIRTMRQLFFFGWTEIERLPQKVAAHPQQPSGHDVVERRHPPE